jgi:hypothetical protein
MSISEQDGTRIATALEGVVVAFEQIAKSLATINDRGVLTEEEQEMNRLHAEVEKVRLQKFIENGYKDPEPEPNDPELTEAEKRARLLVLKNSIQMETNNNIQNREWYLKHGQKKEQEVIELEVQNLKSDKTLQENDGPLFDALGGTNA